MSTNAYARSVFFERQDGLCRYCKRQMTMSTVHPTLTCTVDHVVPRAEGGASAIVNYVGACRQCNNARGTIPAELFARYVRRFATLANTCNWYRRRNPPQARIIISAPPINDVLRVKLEEAIRARIAQMDGEMA